MKKYKTNYLQIGGIVLLGAAIVIGLALTSNGENASDVSNGKLEISEPVYDFGEIPITGGVVTHEFKVKNVGSGPIDLKGLKTSCMCTTAVVAYGEKTSPVFGMHNNPTFYSQTINPGEEVRVVATFDPMFHGPNGTGYITRTIDVFTNEKDYKLRFNVTVVK